MSFLLHGGTLALAWFATVNIAASVMVALIANVLATRQTRHSPSVWFGLRIFPAVAAAIFVAALFVPSYWRYEPREFVEGFDISLTTFALVALTLVAVAIARGVGAWRRARARRDGGRLERT